MPAVPPQLPPKQDVALALLQTASSVFIHLDPRGQDVHVPAWFKKQPQLVLQIGLNMAVAIPDLDVNKDGISCTLSFNRSPEFCRIPWTAIYGLVGEDGRGMIWPDSVPAEIAASADGRAPVAQATRNRRPKLRLAAEDGAPKGQQPAAASGDAPSSSGTTSEAGTEASGGASASQETESRAEDASLRSSAGKGGEKAGSVAADERQSESPTEASDASGAGKGKRALPPYLRVVK